MLNEIYSKAWCDLLFENRNKKYGAYVMRSKTGHRYAVGLIVIFLIFFFMVAPPLVFWLLEQQPFKKVDPVDKMARIEGIQLKEARPVRRPPLKSDPELLKRVKDIRQTDAPDEQDVATINHPEDANLDPEKIKDLPADSQIVLEQEAKLHLANKTEQTDGVILDSIPRYPTGIIAFMRWLNSTVIYPPSCIRNHVEGIVEVAFIVEPTGKIADPRILKSASPELDHEAMRVVHLMPKWVPAQKNGKTIRAQVTLPIVFEITN